MDSENKLDIDHNTKEKSHWEKYQLYYLVFGTFFVTAVIILISNSSINNQIRKISEQLNNISSRKPSLPKNNPSNHNYKSGEFIIPSDDQKSANWLEETVFQENVREEFQIWVNSVKYLPQYRIGGQAEPERHALFYGSPGSGKTYLAEMFAKNEALGYIFAKFGTETYAGSSQQKVNSVMEQAQELLKEKKEDKPVVIIIDEMDSVGEKNSMSGNSVQEVNAILTMIDDIKRENLNIIVIGITNYPKVLDPALKRAGRLGRQIKIPYLTQEEITKMVNYLEKDMKKEQVGSLKYEGNKSQWEKEEAKERFIEWTSDFWSQVRQITQAEFTKCRQAKVGISYTDLEISIKDAIAIKTNKNSKIITPQPADFKKELAKKVEDKIRDKPVKRKERKNPIPVPDKNEEDEN